MNIWWDADQYKRHFAYVAEYGKSLLDMLNVASGSKILDLGCGNGYLTSEIQKRGYTVCGIDSSPEQVKEARKQYPEIEFAVGDATNFHLPTPIDAVFSNAVFHWIDKYKQLNMLNCIVKALKPGGKLVCEFGGYGNNIAIHTSLGSSFARRGLTYTTPFYFPTIGEYAPMLETTGLRPTFMQLYPRRTQLSGKNGLADWIRMFIRSPFQNISETDQENIIHEIEEELAPSLQSDGVWYADYMRLRIIATKD